MLTKPVPSKLVTFNLDFLKEEIKIPTAEEVKSKYLLFYMFISRTINYK